VRNACHCNKHYYIAQAKSYQSSAVDPAAARSNALRPSPATGIIAAALPPLLLPLLLLLQYW
jgi:hypothetical protein